MSGISVSRREFLQQIGIVSGTVLLAGCAVPTGPSGTATGSESAGDVGQEPQTLSFMNWDEIGGTPFETVINAYMEETGAVVDVQPAPSQDYETKMRTMIAGGTAADVMRINDDFVRGYSAGDLIIDLTPYLDRDGIDVADYFEPIFEFARQPDGRYTAWSVGAQPAVIYYNVDMFNEAGVPLPPTTWTDEGWKWEDFLEAAKQLTIPGERWGALVYDATAHEQTFPVNNGEESGIYSFDGTEFTLANPKAVEAVQWVSDLTCVHGVQPEWAVLQRSGAANGLFVAGNLGMYLRLFGVTPYLRQNVTDFTWDVAPVPGRVNHKTMATIVCFCIPKVAQNPDGGWDLLRFMADYDGGSIFAESGAFIPPLKAAADLIEPGDQPPQHIKLFLEALDHSTTENFSTHIERARNFYRPELDLVYTCQASAEEVLNRVRPEVEAALAGEL